MQKTNFYEVIANSEDMDGSGYDITIGFFKTEPEALLFANGKGVMGTPAKVKLSEVYFDDESGICFSIQSAFKVEDLSDQVLVAQNKIKANRIAVLKAELAELEN
jgi:hypothetical protein